MYGFDAYGVVGKCWLYFVGGDFFGAFVAHGVDFTSGNLVANGYRHDVFSSLLRWMG